MRYLCTFLCTFLRQMLDQMVGQKSRSEIRTTFLIELKTISVLFKNKIISVLRYWTSRSSK